MNLLIPNLGSTSLKYQILEMPSETVLAKGRLERVSDYREAIAQISTGGTRIDAVALKAVHAGPRYRGTFVVDEDVVAALEQFLPAAPAHNAIYLTAIAAFREAMPGVPIVAAFEPEFHATMPEYARLYGVPGAWLEEGVAKYGFHGASHQYIAERVAAMLGRQVKLVSCHLGGSSSMCAIDGGRSVDTTMGFSPQSGLENATRHGDLDVFAVLYMMERHGWSPAEVRAQLARRRRTGGALGGGGRRRARPGEAAAAGGSERGTGAGRVRLPGEEDDRSVRGGDGRTGCGGVHRRDRRELGAAAGGVLRGLEFLGIELDAERNENGQRATGWSRLAGIERLRCWRWLPTKN